jgi:hypothetical protein
MPALIPLEYCAAIASFNASAQPTRCPRLCAGAPIEFAALVQPAGFGVGRLCFSTLSASSLSRACKCSITFLGCFIPLFLTSFWIPFTMALLSRPSIWQLVRIKLISCFVNKQLFVRRASLMCSRASSLVLFTTVLELPLAMTLTAVILLVTDRNCWGGGEEGGGRVGEVMATPAEASPLAWVRYRAEFYLPLFWVSLSLSVFSLCSFSFLS